MRFRYEGTDTLLDTYPWGENAILVCIDRSIIAIAGLGKNPECDPILPGPVWRTRDSLGNPVYYLQVDNRIFIHYKGGIYPFVLEERVLEDSEFQPNEIRSPMPGKILKIYKQKGERFEKGENLILLEAMKMENQLKAPFAGIISCLHVKEGELVRQDALLMDLENTKKT